MEIDKIYNMDCLQDMTHIPDGSIETWIINHDPQCMCMMLILCIVIGACMIFGSMK